MPKKIHTEITLVAITTEGRQLTGSGYASFTEAKRKMRERISLSKAPGEYTTKYRRFVIVASVGGVDGIHVFDNNGHITKEAFL